MKTDLFCCTTSAKESLVMLKLESLLEKASLTPTTSLMKELTNRMRTLLRKNISKTKKYINLQQKVYLVVKIF